jgi:hypothetical protein
MIGRCLLPAAFVCAIVLLPHLGRADPDQRQFPQALEQTIGEFWNRWEGIKPSEALRRSAPTPDDQRAWEDLGRHADDYQSRTGGRCLGHSELARKSLGDNMQYIVFFALYEPTPLRVHLLLYKAKDNWTIIALKIDGEPYRWLEEAAQSQLPTPPAGSSNAPQP